MLKLRSGLVNTTAQRTAQVRACVRRL